MQVEYHVIDASNQILGRLASQVAKRALLGEHIIVTNAQDAVISGSRKEIIKRERALQNVRTRFNPRRGPFHPSRQTAICGKQLGVCCPRRSGGARH
jgi:large subunit ribosomal protein L13